MSNIKGLAVSKQSNNCYLAIIGSWLTTFEKLHCYCDILQSTESTLLEGKSYVTLSHEYNKFIDCFVEGSVTYKVISSYINCIFFTKCVFTGNNKTEYAIILDGTSSLQNLTFEQCDISYYSNSLVNIVQEVPFATLKFSSCYFDSNIPVCKDYKKVSISLDNNYDASGGANPLYGRTENIFYQNFAYNNFDAPKLDNIFTNNLVKNGDFSYSGENALAKFYTNKSANLTLSFVDTVNNISKKALKIECADGTGLYGMDLNCVYPPISGPMVLGIRGKKISGTGSLQLVLNEQYRSFSLTKLSDNEDFYAIFSTSRRPEKWVTAGKYPSVHFYFQNPTNLVVELYEIVAVCGSNVRFGMPLEEKAKVNPVVMSNSARPSNIENGYMILDAVTHKPLWYYDGLWYDANGVSV